MAERSKHPLSDQSYIDRRMTIARQVDEWRRVLGSKIEAPPLSLSGQSKWTAGYRAALLDLAELRVDGRRI